MQPEGGRAVWYTTGAPTDCANMTHTTEPGRTLNGVGTVVVALNGLPVAANVTVYPAMDAGAYGVAVRNPRDME